MSEVFDKIKAQIDGLAMVADLAGKGQYKEAINKLDELELAPSTKSHLRLIINSTDPYVVDRTVDELIGRISQSLCWDCWKD